MNKSLSPADSKRIVLLIPSLLGGGTEKSVLTISHEFLEQGREVHLLVLERGKDYKIMDSVIVNTLSSLHGNKIGGVGLKKYFYLPVQFYNLLHYLRKNRIKTVVSFLQRSNLINVFLKIVYSHTAVANVRTTLSKQYDDSGFLGKIKHILNNCIRFADAIICNSEGVKYDLIEKFDIIPESIKVIHNAYDIELIKTLSKEEPEPEYNNIFDSPVIINVGRLATPKAQWHLIRAFKAIKTVINDTRLVILGDGGLAPYLKQLVLSMGLEKDVYFLGFQKNPFKFISRAKVFVLSSIWEGFPNVLVEAMICGTPVVSTDCKSGPREILAPGTDILSETGIIEYAKYGILVPTPDNTFYDVGKPLTKEELLLSDAVIAMLRDEDMRSTYSSVAQLRVMDYEKNKIVKEFYESIFQKTDFQETDDRRQTFRRQTFRGQTFRGQTFRGQTFRGQTFR